MSIVVDENGASYDDEEAPLLTMAECRICQEEDSVDALETPCSCIIAAVSPSAHMTHSNGACTRTLKVLMTILNGKWIVTTQWVKACIEAGRLVDAEPYEVTLDTHGCSGGPKAGRLRVLNNEWGDRSMLATIALGAAQEDSQ